MAPPCRLSVCSHWLQWRHNELETRTIAGIGVVAMTAPSAVFACALQLGFLGDRSITEKG